MTEIISLLPTSNQPIFEKANQFVQGERNKLSEMPEAEAKELFELLLEQTGLTSVAKAFGPNAFTSGVDNDATYRGEKNPDNSVILIYETRDEIPSRVFYFFPKEDHKPDGITCCITVTDLQHKTQGDAYVNDTRQFMGISRSQLVQPENDFPPVAFAFQLP